MQFIGGNTASHGIQRMKNPQREPGAICHSAFPHNLIIFFFVKKPFDLTVMK
jgi:hypothetical protein